MQHFCDLLSALTTPPVGRSRRISSNEQPDWNDGNFDMTPLAPGQVYELPTLRGSGVIKHIWLTSHAGGVGELDALTLRIYWDGRAEPGVEVPLGPFFAVGQGRPTVVESLPVQVSPTGSLTCYWPMPFAESARIVISNDNPDRTSGLYWQVDWTELPCLPPDTGYFHARYRQEYPCSPGDYLIADIEGRGNYVGTVLSVTLGQDGWFGEGDDFFYIDGEETPSLQGTGSEDYFNDAWGFRQRTSLWFGQPRWQGWRAGDEGICYRWHILDPVGFEKSLKVTIEHKGNHDRSEDSWFVERPDFISSVSMWYQTGEPKRFGGVPSWTERRVPWERHHLVRALRQSNVTGSARPVVRTTGFFGGRPALYWRADEPVSALRVPFAITAEGRYALRLTAFTGPECGTFDILVDGRAALLATVLTAEEPDEDDLLLGARTLSAGEHMLLFRPSSGAVPSGALAVEELRLLKLPPAAERIPKNHNEAHFIRLGIGRALYAYRLAYDELPDSLENLVALGIMEERFLHDENLAPLKAWREGDRFLAQAANWQHEWRGLDARR